MSEGVRKVSEYIMKSGRTIIITDNSVQAENVPPGTLFINPDSGAIQIKLKDATSWTKLSPVDMFEPFSIPNSLLADRSIVSTKVALLAIDNQHIKDTAVTTAKVKDLSIITTKLADDSISTIKIKNENITTEKIAERAITNILLGDNSVSNRTIIDDCISTSKIQDLSITAPKLALNIISTQHIVDKAITTDKLAENAITENSIADYSITNSKLASLAVNTRTIADKSITTAKLADKNVTLEKMADNSVGALQLVQNAVTTAKILDSAVTAAKVATASIGKFHVDAALKAEIERLNPYVVIASNTISLERNVTVKGNITATGNITGARVYNAVFNDLAEGFEINEKTEPGDIIEVDKLGRANKAQNMSRKVVGVHSDCYAQLFGATQEDVDNGLKVPVALVGRVPVKIIGKAQVGDLVVAFKDGIGTVNNKAANGTIIGKVIEEKETMGISRVLCLITLI